MGRFGDEYEEQFNNQGELWWANIQRSIKGKKGQRDLLELEAALLALPKPRLVEGRLATPDGEVCAVAALVLHRRVRKGEDKDAVVKELAAMTQAYCECDHLEEEHEGGVGVCKGCVRWVERFAENGRELPEGYAEKYGRPCQKFRDSGEIEEDGGDQTASVGQRVGMTYSLAWRLAYLNDEDYGGLTPEARYERVLAWTREQLGREEAA